MDKSSLLTSGFCHSCTCRHLVNLLDEGHAALGLTSIASRPPILFHGTNTSFARRLISAKVVYHRRRRALVQVGRFGGDKTFRPATQMSRNDDVILKNYCTLGACDLNPSRVTRISSGGRKERC